MPTTRKIGDDMSREEYKRHIRRQNLKLAAEGVKSAIMRFQSRLREARFGQPEDDDTLAGAYVPEDEAAGLYAKLQQMIVDIRTAERRESDAREQAKREGGGT